MPPDLRDQTILLTGANAGIGRAVAEQLATRGATLLMVCRNEERGAPALQEIVQATGNERVELFTADLASQAEIRRLVDEVKGRHTRLDVLINNAGLYQSKRVETEDGVELTLAVNHLAPFMLTLGLLGLLKASVPARVVNVSSEAHQGAKLNIDELNLDDGYHWIKAYGNAKLANVLFTYELARRLEGTGVTANVMHPGVVASRIWNRNRNPVSLIMQVGKLFMLSPTKSALHVVRLATDPALQDVSGQYFDKDREAESSAISYDEDLARRLWDKSLAMTGIDDPTV